MESSQILTCATGTNKLAPVLETSVETIQVYRRQLQHSQSIPTHKALNNPFPQPVLSSNKVGVDIVHACLPSELWKAGPKHDFLSACRVGKIYKLRGIVLWRPRAGVDVYIIVLPSNRNCLSSPRISYMSHDDLEVGEFERDGVDVWDGRPTSLGQAGAVCPTCVRNGMSSSMHLTKSG